MIKIKPFVVGVDEVGRGPLAGPVTVSVVFFRSLRSRNLLGIIKDSKLLSEKRRGELARVLRKLRKKGEISFSIFSVSARTIDRIGIARAVRLATSRALLALGVGPRAPIYLDGSMRAPRKFKNQKTIIGGDTKFEIIAIASIVAKVFRDRKMTRFSKKYPHYGLDIHKGYGTNGHIRAIKKYGPCKIHRRSFIKNFV